MTYTGKDGSFNPRAREGRDSSAPWTTSSSSSFNPRAREGRDSTMLKLDRMHIEFQSTRP